MIYRIEMKRKILFDEYFRGADLPSKFFRSFMNLF